jgi:lipopolysaccharide transport system ATP-binding protein
MSDTVIRVENLSKKYLLGHQQQGRSNYKSIREIWTNGINSLSKKILNPRSNEGFNPAQEEFWALKDVSFEIKQGDRIGIIGHNGAGKSTLLKILSRITEPTQGRISIKGRVASLLEVGTGFHPELTGRENVYLNGAILGMSKNEIKRKFDEIVAFAEVEKFLDTPVKRYSSGMYIRLAFAVAAHLEPEILIVDEVLAVGDAKFQKKCLMKMQDVSSNEGKTILVVSHNMQTVLSLCNKSVLLSNGQIKKIGSSEEAARDYLNSGDRKTSFRIWSNANTFPGNDVVKLHSIKVIDKKGNSSENFKISEPIGIQMIYEVLKEEILWQGYNFYNSEGINIFDSHNVNTQWYREPHPKGKFTSTAWIPANFLAEGEIIVSCAIFNHQSHKIYFHEKDVIAFNIVDTYEANSARGDSVGRFPGMVRPLLKWESTLLNSLQNSLNH